MKRKAFTLVELIVVITILAILGTIAFISLSGYSKEARDAKRSTDTSSLLSKINIEETRGTPLSDLITNTDDAYLKILGNSGSLVKTFGEADFKTLKENEKNFRDPSNKNQNYPLAYAIGGTGKDAYKFIQIATVSEKENKNIIKGNYYTLDENDDESLFHSGSTTYTENKTPLVYELDGVVPKEPETPKIGCAEKPKYTNAVFTEGTTESYNVAWQNTDSSAACYYKCEGKCMVGADINDCNASGDLLFAKSKYENCDTNDIVICTGKQKGHTLAACNIGASVASDYTTCTETDRTNCDTAHLGLHFQWGNNRGTPIEATKETTEIVAGPITVDKDTPASSYSGDFVIIATGIVNWISNPQVDDLWGEITNTKEARKGPCADGYYVPSADDWDEVGTLWEKTDIEGISKDLFGPRSGYRFGRDFELKDTGINAGLWASSPYPEEHYSHGTWLTNGLIYTKDGKGSKGNAIPVRCFKN